MCCVSSLWMLITLMAVVPRCAVSARSEEEVILDKLFNNKTYNRAIRPLNKAKLIVRVNVFIREIYSVNELNREMSLQLILRLRWRDERLIFNSSRLNYILVGRSRSERLWVPDMFITNEKEAQVHKTLSDNALIRIYPNGQVQHSVRISLSLSCPVNASWFPFGSVSCPLRVASYSRELTEMQLSWDDGGLAFYRGIELDGYRLENFSIRTEQCVTSIKLGKFSCVSSVIRLRRLPRRWLFTLFVPCVVLAGCAAITASFRRKNEHIVNALCFVAVIGITLQVSNAPSSDVIHAVDAWVLLVYGFFLFHIVLISYPKSKTNGCCSRRENSNQLPRTTRRFLEDNARIVFYGIFSAITLTYFIVVRLCTD